MSGETMNGNASPGNASSPRRKLARMDTANPTDMPISSACEDNTSNGHSKDIITDEFVRHKAYRWCMDSVGGAWLQVASEEELVIAPISGGMSNYLYLISLPETIKPINNEPTEVLLRIYGQISKSTLDFLVHNSVVFALLAERKLGPKPYGMYHDGRIEEFIKASPLRPSDLKGEGIMSMVSERLAKFHTLDMPLCKKPRWFKSMVRGWIREIEDNLDSSSEVLGKLAVIAPSFDLGTEFHNLLDMASKLDCPVVFCHNDLQSGNVLVADKGSIGTPQMTIIDWEYAHYNYRGFDMGNHFNEWMFDYSSEGKPGFRYLPENYPSRQQQYFFFNGYLKAQGKVNVSEAELATLYKEVNTLMLHSHFLWSVWSLIQAQSSSIEFDYNEYALTRFQAYFDQKNNLSALISAS